MTLVAEIFAAQQKMARSLQPAMSAKNWHNVLSKKIKPTFNLLYSFSWIKNIEITPSVSAGALFGDCLAPLVEAQVSESDIQQASGKPSTLEDWARSELTSTRKQHNSTNKNPATNAFATTVANKHAPIQKTALPQPLLTNKKANNLNQVHAQNKSANVTSLKSWLNHSDKSNLIKKDLQHKQPPPKDKLANNVSNLVSHQQRKLNDNKLANLSQNIHKWKQQITQQIQSVLERHVTEYSPKLGKQNAHSLRSDKTEIWVKQLRCTDQDNMVSTHILNQLQSKTNHVKQRTADAHVAKVSEAERAFHKEPISEILNPHPPRESLLAEETKYAAAINPNGDTTEIQTKRQKAMDKTSIDHKKNAGFSATQSTNEVDASFPPNKDEPHEHPEFPPVEKKIIDELQLSGKRTALKPKPEPNPLYTQDMDDEALADALKRIIDNEARRHGIDV